MNDKLNDFKKKLLASGIVQEHQLVGCSSQELMELEQKYGKLPASYKQVMKLLGKRPGPLVGREWDFYIDDIREFNKDYQPIFQEELEEKNISKNIFIVLGRYGEARHFIWANGESDSPVFRWPDDGEIEEINSSVWEWMDDWILDAQEMMKLRNEPVYYSDYWKRNF